MVSFFETAVLKLQQLGFFSFLLPFLLTAAIVYGLLRRSQLFGDPEKNIAINTIVAFSISLFVWGAPVILGINVEGNLAAFFAQGIAVSLVIIIGLMFASTVFPPDLAKNLSEKIKAPAFWGAIVVIGILLGIVLLVTSGLVLVFFPKGTGINLSSDIFITIGALVILAISVVAIIMGSREEKK